MQCSDHLPARSIALERFAVAIGEEAVTQRRQPVGQRLAWRFAQAVQAPSGRAPQRSHRRVQRLGIEEGTQLPRSIIEFYYKNEKLDDPMVSEEHITAFGWATPNCGRPSTRPHEQELILVAR